MEQKKPFFGTISYKIHQSVKTHEYYWFRCIFAVFCKDEVNEFKKIAEIFYSHSFLPVHFKQETKQLQNVFVLFKPQQIYWSIWWRSDGKFWNFFSAEGRIRQRLRCSYPHRFFPQIFLRPSHSDKSSFTFFFSFFNPSAGLSNTLNFS